MFLAAGAACLFVGALDSRSFAFLGSPFLPGLLTPFILIRVACVLLVFSLGHYLIALGFKVQMNTGLAVTTLVMGILAIWFRLAGALAFEEYLSSATRPADNPIFGRFMTSEICGALALALFVTNVIVTAVNRSSGPAPVPQS